MEIFDVLLVFGSGIAVGVFLRWMWGTHGEIKRFESGLENFIREEKDYIQEATDDQKYL